MFYIVFFIGLLLAAVNKKEISAKVFAAVLFLLAAFRYGQGADYFSYATLYYWSSGSVITELVSGNGSQEIGYRFLSAIFKHYNLPYQIFISVIAVINIYFIYKTSVKYTKNPTLSMLIYYSFYYFVWTYSSLRQGLALSIGLYYMLEAIRDSKNTIKFLIIAVAVSLLHSSALVFIVMFGITKIKLGKKQLLILLAVSIAFNIVPLEEIVRKLSEYIPVLTRILYYTNGSLGIGDFTNFKSVARFTFLFIAFLIYDVYCEESPENRKIMNIYIFSYILYFFFKFSELTAARLAIYGKILDIVIFSNAYYMLRRKENKIIYVMALFALMVLYFLKEQETLHIQSKLETAHKYMTPYVNIFNKRLYHYGNLLQQYLP